MLCYCQPSRCQRPLLVIGGLLRVGLIPIFMFCNVQPRSHLPVVFNHDAVPIVAMFVFALSNGYFGTLCMMYGPR
jgi:solute carrier family 29 (equilibrative nucleoside transporter), member 1/2/3